MKLSCSLAVLMQIGGASSGALIDCCARLPRTYGTHSRMRQKGRDDVFESRMLCDERRRPVYCESSFHLPRKVGQLLRLATCFTQQCHCLVQAVPPCPHTCNRQSSRSLAGILARFGPGKSPMSLPTEAGSLYGVLSWYVIEPYSTQPGDHQDTDLVV